MYQIDTSTGYSLIYFEQISYAAPVPIPSSHGYFSPDWSIGNSQNHSTDIRLSGE
jgi:hypothetical protein